jgi:type VI secretion system FHA domain protein
MASLQLKLISGGELDQNQSFDFFSHGGTIGRSKDCDWTLHDPDRYISNRHILITVIDNRFVLTDVSSNGVFINKSQVPIGKGNTHVLARGDLITLGKFCLEVAAVEQQTAPVPAPMPVASHNAEPGESGNLRGFFNSANRSQSPVHSDIQSQDSLGLFAILSGDVKSAPQKNLDYESPRKPEESVASSASQSFSANLAQGVSSNDKSAIQQSLQTTIPTKNLSPSTIPDDWDFDASLIIPRNTSQPEQKIPAAAQQVSQAQRAILPASPISAEAENTVQAKQTKPSDSFFELLYEKLGLPKEQLDSVDQSQFAHDLVQILTTSTQGIMALLAGRSVFKQESRLSMTMIKPQSNNPIKFSLDPSDTLEMLLVKKKPGYMSAQDAYAEAMNDAQLHQTAFLSGLQATLSGLIDELSPSVIERELSKKEKGFLGLKANAQKWQLFVEKQDVLRKQVAENLNDILSRHFSGAYEKHIDDANKKK